MSGSAAELAMLDQLLALAPPGTAYPRDRASNWGRALAPLGAEHARLKGEADALVPEVDQRLSTRLLPDYERVLGDDPCLGPAAALPLDIRQRLAHQRWTSNGGASPAYFIALAAAAGVAITITESVPFETGVAETGTELIGEDGRFEWIVGLPATQLIEFETGVAETGTAMGDFLPSVVECLIRRRAPAHTTVYFAYGS